MSVSLFVFDTCSRGIVCLCLSLFRANCGFVWQCLSLLCDKSVVAVRGNVYRRCVTMWFVCLCLCRCGEPAEMLYCVPHLLEIGAQLVPDAGLRPWGVKVHAV